MKIALKFAIYACMLGATGLSHAETVKRSMPACVTEELWDEFGTYIAKGDRQGAAQLFLSGKCVMLEKGEQISVISPGFMTATVRYKGVKLFTASEAIR